MKVQLLKTITLFSIIASVFSCSTKEVELNNEAVSLFEDSIVHQIKIIPITADLRDKLVQAKEYTNKNESKNIYQMCQISIDGEVIDSIGIRYKGQSSYDYTENDKKSFKIKLNEFVKKQNYQKFKKFNLNNQFKDPSFLREKITLDVLRSEDLPAAKSSFANVYFGDELLGLYLIVEDIDKRFLKKNFNSKKGVLYNGKPKAHFITPTEDVPLISSYKRKNRKKSTDFSDLENLILYVNSVDSAGKYDKELDSVFNVKDCLKQWAINNFIVNIDTYNMLYRHNFMLYFEPIDSTTTMCHWIGYDYNYSFAAWSPVLTLEKVEKFNIHYIDTPNVGVPLAVRLLGDSSQYLEYYDQYLSDFITRKVNSKWLENRITSLHEMIKQDVYNDPNKMYSDIDFDLNVKSTIGDPLDPGAFSPGLLDLLEARTVSVKKQLELKTPQKTDAKVN